MTFLPCFPFFPVEKRKIKQDLESSGEGGTELLLPAHTETQPPPRQGIAQGASLVCAMLTFISLYGNVRKMKATFCGLSSERTEPFPVLQLYILKNTKFNGTD